MNYDDDWPDATRQARRAAILKTIRPVTRSELRELGEKRLPVVTDPWYTRYFDFINAHPDGTFYLAASSEGAEVIYCKENERGVWFLPGRGMGIIQPKGLQVLKEIVDSLG
jgi:hypothetical protein